MALHKKKRLGFSFLNSYYQIYQRLNNKQKILFMDKLLSIQFLESNIKDISFADNVVDLSFSSIEHSLSSTIEGYLSQARKHGAYIGAYEGGSIGAYIQEQEQVQEEEQEKEKEQYVKETLKRVTQYTNLPEDYKKEFWIYAFGLDGAYCMESMIDYCKAHGKGYKDYKSAYNNWVKRERLNGTHKGQETKVAIDEQGKEFLYANGFGYYAEDKKFVNIALGGDEDE